MRARVAAGVLAVAALGLVGAGAWLLCGLGAACLSVGGLLWLDLFAAGLYRFAAGFAQKGGKR